LNETSTSLLTASLLNMRVQQVSENLH